MRQDHYAPWPELPYDAFAPTAYLLHRGLQAAGKLKLSLPFETHWAEVALAVTTRGLSTGPIAHGGGVFSVEFDMVSHSVACAASWGTTAGFALAPMAVAQFHAALVDALQAIGVRPAINPKPQEVPDPIPFPEDTRPRPYDASLANAWWRILVSAQRVMTCYHARFQGKSPPVGFMWGTFDLRDARYNGVPVPATGANAGYIRRNAMNEAQIECGFWSGSPQYPKPAFYSFTYPQPAGIEAAAVQPAAAGWNASLGEFVLDYDDLRKAADPEADLFAFLESAYAAGAGLAGWDPGLVGTGKPA